MNKSAKELFRELGYEYSYVKGENCEDTIVYTNKENNKVVQFNLMSQMAVYMTENKYKEYDELHCFATKELVRAVYTQIEELNWYE